MNFARTPEQENLYAATLKFARGKLGHLREGGFSRSDWDHCTAQGLTALMSPAELGGSGLNAASVAVVMEALGEGCADGGFNFSLGAHLFAGLVPVLAAGSEEQKKIYAGGSRIIANAMTETGSGSDAFGMKTTAVKTANGYVLNGSKSFCTNAAVADTLLVYAVTDPKKGFFGGISAFLVGKDSTGLRIGAPQEKTGLHSSPLSDIFLDHVAVDENQLLGKAGAGAQLFQQSMNWERMGLSALHTGTMQRLCRAGAEYANTRTIGEKKIGGFQAVSFRIADMYTRTEAARLLVHAAAAAIDSGNNATTACAKAKIYASEALIATAQEAMLIHGGNGLMKSTGIEQALRDAMASVTYSGTNDVLRSLLAGLL